MPVCSTKNKDCSYRYTWMRLTWLKRSRLWLPLRGWCKTLILTNAHPFLDHVYLGCTQRECKPNEIMVDEYRKMCESRMSAGWTEKLPEWEKPHAKTVAWSHDTEGHAQRCVERHCELANKRHSSYTKSQKIVHIRKSHVCSNKLDVQEANVSFTQFDGIW